MVAVQKRRKRSKRVKLTVLQVKIAGLAFTTLAFLYAYSSWKSHLETLRLKANRDRLHLRLRPASVFKDLGPAPDKYLIFVNIRYGQGSGNIIAGLLAAHLLALEYNRIVCVHNDYTEFHAAFEAIHPWAVEKCPSILKHLPNRFEKERNIQLLNYAPFPPDECELQTKLASDERVLFYEGNTYPRWPRIPDNFFFTYYQPKLELIAMLSYDQPPETVVHLRAPDGDEDRRKGLDDVTLNALGRELPHDTYLVTNRVEWYDKFEEEFGWSHPYWNEVFHSALLKSWGSRDHHIGKVKRDKDLQNMQMWADWLTILNAKRVYHTHSDFSVSAIHWQNIESKSIRGYNSATNQLDVVEESWIVDGETAALVERTMDAADHSHKLRCGKNTALAPRIAVRSPKMLRNRLE